MPIIAKRGSGDFEPAPEGVHQCVCVDVVDMGMVSVEWQGKKSVKHMVQIRWQTKDLMKAKDGQPPKPYLIVRRFTNSLHEKAGLRKLLESWRGKKFTAQELDGFDLEKLIGANCQIQVVHNEKGYADITSIMKYTGEDKLEPRHYIRVIDRLENDNGKEEGALDYKGEIPEPDDIPF